ncbi:hypothetical protein [Psychrobacter sp. W2-37-MNA-CIBAN-0211]|uniref:hypothetical protein n=1 Tax=Psychrobacter sp. W2-37-MNA-CIBAN-0211 TaxID=3140443 RepID=UPI003332F855
MTAISENSLLLQAQRASTTCALLWQRAGISAERAAEVFAAMPCLQNALLQPIGDNEDPDTPIAYTLTAPLLTAFSRLSQLGEWQLALLGLNPSFREHWLCLAAARCREAGSMRDPQMLIKIISQLSDASAWVLEELEGTSMNPQLCAGPLSDLEHELIGHSLHDNAALPALLRILRASYQLTGCAECSAHESDSTITSLPPIDPSAKALDKNWCARRLLALPYSLLNQTKPHASWILTERGSSSDTSSHLTLFTQQPWLFLLSLLVFVQDAWAAEQRDSLLLVLPSNQNAFSPTEINIVVQGIEGDEVNVGNLAAFLLALLNNLNISLYPKIPDTHDLNRALAPLVANLLSRQIWQFKEGGRNETGLYSIHPDFGDACYSLPLAPIFSYRSARLQQAIKQTARDIRAAKLINIQGSGL